MPADDLHQPPGSDPDLSRVGPAGLSTLWPRQTTAASEPWDPQDLGGVLRHQLSLTLGQVTEIASSPEADRVCADLLLGVPPPSGAAALRQLKDWAKPHMSHDGAAEVPREVAGVLYFAAILAARLRLGERISHLGDDRLHNAIQWALQLPWMDARLAQLFREGVVSASAADKSSPGT